MNKSLFTQLSICLSVQLTEVILTSNHNTTNPTMSHNIHFQTCINRGRHTQTGMCTPNTPHIA